MPLDHEALRKAVKRRRGSEMEVVGGTLTIMEAGRVAKVLLNGNWLFSMTKTQWDALMCVVAYQIQIEEEPTIEEACHDLIEDKGR